MRMMTIGLPVAITLAGFVVAWHFVNPAPPRTIRIATGQPDGAYHLFAEQYRAALADNGIELQLQQTAGSVENLALLRNGDVDLAFVQGGSAAATPASGLVALGSVYYEPLWVFYHRPDHADRLTDFSGRRLATGPEGSGTRALVTALLQDNGIAHGLAMDADAARLALLQRQVDAAFFVASPRAPVVNELLSADGLNLLSFSRAAAYSRRHRAIAGVVLPEGAIDLQANIPPRDTVLLAVTANLVATEDFHPALVSLLLQIAGKVHGVSGMFQDAGEFPNQANINFPLAEQAEHFYRHGQPLLQRYLPFWTANLIDRLKIMLVPLLTLLIPLIKVLPPAYRWQVRRKIYRWYRELHTLDIEHPERTAATDLAAMLQKLDDIEREVQQVKVPLSYDDELFSLRLHIDLVRQQLKQVLDRRKEGTPA